MLKQSVILMAGITILLAPLFGPLRAGAAESKIEISQIYFTHGGAIGPANIMCIVGTGYPEQARVFIDGREVSYRKSASNCFEVTVAVNYAPQTHTVQVTDQWRIRSSDLVRARF